MMKPFTLDSLSKDVREKVSYLDFEYDEYKEKMTGFGDLYDGWCYDGDSHTFTFDSKQELINFVRTEVEKEEIL